MILSRVVRENSFQYSILFLMSLNNKIIIFVSIKRYIMFGVGSPIFSNTCTLSLVFAEVFALLHTVHILAKLEILAGSSFPSAWSFSLRPFALLWLNLNVKFSVSIMTIIE